MQATPEKESAGTSIAVSRSPATGSKRKPVPKALLGDPPGAYDDNDSEETQDATETDEPAHYAAYDQVQLVDGDGKVMAYAAIVDDEPRIPNSVQPTADDDEDEPDANYYKPGCYKKIEMGQVVKTWGPWQLKKENVYTATWKAFRKAKEKSLNALKDKGAGVMIWHELLEARPKKKATKKRKK